MTRYLMITLAGLAAVLVSAIGDKENYSVGQAPAQFISSSPVSSSSADSDSTYGLTVDGTSSSTETKGLGETGELTKTKPRRRGKLLKNILIAKIPSVQMGMMMPKSIFTAGIATRNSGGGGGGWGMGGGGGGGGGWGGGGGGRGWGSGGGGGGWGGGGGGGGGGGAGWALVQVPIHGGGGGGGHGGGGGGGGGGDGWGWKSECEDKKVAKAKAKAKKKIAKAKAKAEKKAAKGGGGGGGWGWGPPPGWGPPQQGWGGGGGSSGGGGWGGSGGGGHGKGGGGGGGGWGGGGGGGGKGGGGGGWSGGGGGSSGGGGGWRSLQDDVPTESSTTSPTIVDLDVDEFKDEVWPNSPPRTARIDDQIGGGSIHEKTNRNGEGAFFSNNFANLNGAKQSLQMIQRAASDSSRINNNNNEISMLIPTGSGPDNGIRIFTQPQQGDESSHPLSPLSSSSFPIPIVSQTSNSHTLADLISGASSNYELANLNYPSLQYNNNNNNNQNNRYPIINGASTGRSDAMSQAMFLRLLCSSFPSMCMYMRR